MKPRIMLFAALIFSGIALSATAFAADEREPGSKPLKRMKYFYERRSFPFERIPENAYIDAREYVKRSANAGSSPMPGGRIFRATRRSSCFCRAL